MSIFFSPPSNFSNFSVEKNRKQETFSALVLALFFFIPPLLPPFSWQNRIKTDEKVRGIIKNSTCSFISWKLKFWDFFYFLEINSNFFPACIFTVKSVKWTFWECCLKASSKHYQEMLLGCDLYCSCLPSCILSTQEAFLLSAGTHSSQMQPGEAQ